MPGQKHLRSFLVAAFALETFCVTYGLKAPRITPVLCILHVLAGTAVAVLLLYFPALRLRFRRREKESVMRAENEAPRPALAWFTRAHQYKLMVMALLALCMYTLCRNWFDEIPLDVNYADMLPIIKVMDQRFLAGHWNHIYDTIPTIWNGVQPIYLPSMWQPFTLAVLLDIDMRWITVAGLLLSFGIFLFIYRPQARSYATFLTGILAFVLFWWIFADDTPGVITVSEEGVVIAYYVLLVLALLSGNMWLTGIAASLCMLSRYALVGWIPAYLLYLILHRKGKQAAIFSLVGLACFLLLFLGPVGWDTFMRLAKLPGDYIRFAAIVWQDSPDVFSTSLGFAGFFGPSRIALLHGLLVVLSFVVPSLFVGVSYFRGRTREFSNVPLAALKMSLVIFYAFIDVPYLYLFYTSSFVSLIVVAFIVSEPGKPLPVAGSPSGDRVALRSVR